tara:strand:+ start:387 stop:878 length:492 start_codon:yes stop_codon:yes gene_type:complete
MNLTNATYSNFNTASFQGVVLNIKVLDGQYGEYVAVTVISNLADDKSGADTGINVTFNNSNGLLSLHKKGWLPVGRQVTVTGVISGVSETYEKDGELHIRKRPEISLKSETVQLHTGAMPKEKQAPAATSGKRVIRRFEAKVEPTVDPTPAITEEKELVTPPF